MTATPSPTHTGPPRLLIDTDPGVDDAIALMMALCYPGARVEAITVVAGNAGLEQTVRNARYIVELCGADVPVHAGAARALLREARRAHHIHGDDGLGNLGLRPRRAAPAPSHAADVIVDTLTRHPGAITLVTLGPLTNVALALLKAPQIATLPARVVVMGGAANVVGNVTPAAEFNVWADPEAARIVFRAGLPLTMVGIEICRGAARWSRPEIAGLDGLGTERARVAAALLRHSHGAERRRGRAAPGDRPGASVPDGTAMAVALEPAVLTAWGHYFVDVETHGELTTGETVVDRRGVLGHPPNAAVAHAIDVARFKELVRAACR
jgi:purine nucleosidase